ncbi:MAG: SIS domain-containing protein [Planctomycetota bacterium]|jgi:glucosamine--fructose-6-phosphate aminotransferase (isomerizing)
MCGIIAILSRPDRRPVPDVAACTTQLAEASGVIRAWAEGRSDAALVPESAVAHCEGVANQLRGFAGFLALHDAGATIEPGVRALESIVRDFESRLDRNAPSLGPASVERLNALLIRLKDARFVLAQDALGNVEPVRALAGGSVQEEHLRVAYDLNAALNALDRLEVRGRDSAGIHLYVHGDFARVLDSLSDDIRKRERTPNFGSGAVRVFAGQGIDPILSFVYKVAAEVGELGDNVAAIRESIVEDALLHRVLETPGVRADILGHTRWASVGVINEANAHPLNQMLDESETAPYAVAALNGDVDNYQSIIREDGLEIPAGITTDAKVIPVLVSRAMTEGQDATEAFRRSVNRFEGSVAIAAGMGTEAGRLYLALRGSGQALYVGLAEGAFVVASEPYGIVEETSLYLRMDGETPSDPARPSSRGQIVVLDAEHAGLPEGVTRISYDGTALPVGEDDLQRTEITTRDIHRGDHPHYLRKEIDESPESIRKTLRGRLVLDDAGARALLGEESLPASVRERLANGEIRRIRVIGQGTAAVAGQGVAEAIRAALAGSSPAVDALPATEVSGFQLADDMSGDLYVAISQSGTTTDTNRTVDLLRARGAAVIGIVNRRHSDLTERVDGILYTSDGRDVEMSVASTKAFYSQIAAGFLLGDALARACGVADEARQDRVLGELAGLPEKMRELLAREDHIAAVASETAPPRRYWALVGNGRNRIAAEEIRIKLSELCYKSIACDATEDKKHIDLSSEPLVLVCAAGLDGGNAADVAKEVEIYAAHKACPVVIASDGHGEWHGAAATLRVPEAAPELAFVLATMAGHLYGYHAAQAIDALAIPLREARGHIEIGMLSTGRGALSTALEAPYRHFVRDLHAGRYDGALDARTASRLSVLFHYATNRLPLEFFAEEYEQVGTPTAVLDRLAVELTRGIDDLSRPIDAIKHQAKTVTVGISRGDEALFALPLVRVALDAGAPRERLSYEEMRVLQALEPAIAEVVGYTRYAIERTPEGRIIDVVGRSGLGAEIPTRTEKHRQLRGTKNTVANERQVLVAVGRSDGRPIVLVPELAGGECKGIVLLHVRMNEDLDAATIRSVLSGYRDRYGKIRDAVTETNTAFHQEDLTRIPLLDLLTKPVLVVADQLVGARTG